MWLLNAETIELHYFHHEKEVPGGYAILSHTWGDEEVSFEEIQKDGAARRKGYTKIQHTCLQAKKDGHSYAWVDTC